MVRVSIIAALDDSGGIGLRNGLPWHIQGDLAHFRRVTQGASVIMGRRTWATLPVALSGRDVIVVSRGGAFFHSDAAAVCGSIDDAMGAAMQSGKQVFIAGGASIYAQCIGLVGRMYLTRVHGTHEADAYFPEVNWREWRLHKAVTGDVCDWEEWFRA